MTDQSITATEARVRTALEQLAQSHRPDPDLHRANEPGTGRPTGGPPPSQRRWLLAVASIAVVGAGIVAVALVPDDVEAPPIDSADTIVSSPEPGPTTAPVQTTATSPVPTTGAPAAVRELRFAEPFDEPMVASLEPDPALPETPALGYDPTASHAEWAHGRDGFGQVWSISNNEWVGSVSVMDEGVPWEIASEGKTLTEISGIDAVVDEALSAVALRLPDGRTRLIQGLASEQSDITATQTAVELAEVIGTNSIESTLPTDRFVLPVGVAGRGPVVQYGDLAAVNTTGLTQVMLERLERTPTDDELRWIATSISEGGKLEQIGPGVFEATVSGGQLSLVELVSPLDLVWILAPAGTDMSTLHESIVIEPLDQSGLSVQPLSADPTTVEVARGEPSWGRWQVATSSDGTCRSLDRAVWAEGEYSANGSGSTSCDPDPISNSAICSALHDGLMLVVVVGVDAARITVELDGQPVAQPIENGDGGAAVLLNDGIADVNRLTVRIDGAPTECGPA